MRDNLLGNSLFMIALFSFHDYSHFCAQDRQATTTLDYTAH